MGADDDSSGAPNRYSYELDGDTLIMTDPLGLSIEYGRQ